MPAQPDVTTVFFDLVGTLISPAEPVGVTYSRFAADYGIVLSPDRVDNEFCRQFKAMSQPPYHPRQSPEKVEYEWWQTLVSSTLDAASEHSIPQKTKIAIFAPIFRHYARGTAWRRFPDTLPVLDELAKRGVQLAVVSNFDSRIHSVLRDLQLDHYFSKVVASSEVGSAKPAPKIFEAALAQTGALPTRTIHAGDDRDADVRGAEAAGIESIWINRPSSDLRTILHHARIPQ